MFLYTLILYVPANLSNIGCQSACSSESWEPILCCLHTSYNVAKGGKVNGKNVHLCVIREELIRPVMMWPVRWLTESDSEAVGERFRKDESVGWTLEEFRRLQNEGYSCCGIILNRELCSHAGLWRRAPDVWEVIAVSTKEEYRHQGMGQCVVYFVAEHILQHLRVASYTSGENNVASIRTAQSVGLKYCANIVNDDKWCASNSRPPVEYVDCPLIT